MELLGTSILQEGSVMAVVIIITAENTDPERRR
jgi:hypothetical protein